MHLTKLLWFKKLQKRTGICWWIRNMVLQAVKYPGLDRPWIHDKGKTMVVVKLDPDLKMTGQGAFSMILSKQLYVSFFITDKISFMGRRPPPVSDCVVSIGGHEISNHSISGLFKYSIPVINYNSIPLDSRWWRTKFIHSSWWAITSIDWQGGLWTQSQATID